MDGGRDGRRPAALFVEASGAPLGAEGGAATARPASANILVREKGILSRVSMSSYCKDLLAVTIASIKQQLRGNELESVLVDAAPRIQVRTQNEESI